MTRKHGTVLCNRIAMGAKDSPNILERLIRIYVVLPVQELVKSAGRQCVIEVYRDKLFISSLDEWEHEAMHAT